MLKISARTGLLLCCIAVVAGATPKPSKQNPQQPPSQGENSQLPAQDGTNAKSPSANLAAPQEIIDAIARAIEAAADKAKTAQNPSPPDNSSWWFNLFLVIFSGALVAVGAFQAIFLRTSVVATEKTAAAAKASADAVVTQLRAYASVTAATIRGFEQDGPLRIQIRISNRGQTPAYELTHEHGFTRGTASVSRLKGDLWPPERDVSLSKVTVPPGVIKDAFIDIDEPLSPEVKSSIRDGTHGLFAYGEIRYKDGFGNPRVSNYRLMYGGGPPIIDGQFTVCEEGNYED